MVLHLTLEIIQGTSHDFWGMDTWNIYDVDPILGRGQIRRRLSFVIHNILAHDPRANLHKLAMDHNVRVCVRVTRHPIDEYCSSNGDRK